MYQTELCLGILIIIIHFTYRHCYERVHPVKNYDVTLYPDKDPHGDDVYKSKGKGPVYVVQVPCIIIPKLHCWNGMSANPLLLIWSYFLNPLCWSKSFICCYFYSNIQIGKYWSSSSRNLDTATTVVVSCTFFKRIHCSKSIHWWSRYWEVGRATAFLKLHWHIWIWCRSEYE